MQGVWPERNSAKWSGDGGIVSKELVSHHVELFISSNTEIRSPDSDHSTISNVGKPLDDQSVPGHLSQPVVIATISPVLGILVIGDGENSNFMTLSVELLIKECAVNKKKLFLQI